MKILLNTIIALLLLATPVAALAQGDSIVYKNIAEKTLGVTSSFKIDDNKAVLQVALSDSTFELIALDTKMQVLWRSQFTGRGVACRKFKGSVLAVSDSAFEIKKESDHTFRAFLVDPQTGKTILQKEIFRQHVKHKQTVSSLWRNDGADFSLIVRQADYHAQTFLFGHLKDSIEDLTMINLNEKLEPEYHKLQFPDETFVSMTGNSHGDLFMLTTIGGTTLWARRYENGSMEPSKPIFVTCDTLSGPDLEKAYNSITPSHEDRNVLYLALAHKNQNSDRELYLARFDFAANTSQTASEVFTGKHIRAIEKSFVPLDAQFGEPNIGSQKKEITVRYLTEHDGKIIVVASEFFEEQNTTTTGRMGVVTVGITSTTHYEKALIINCYDQSLKQQFQQLMPVYYEGKTPTESAFAFHENILKVLSNNVGENADRFPAYGELDLATGKWLNLTVLKGSDRYSLDEHLIWFPHAFIVPSNRATGTFTTRYNVDLFRYTF